MRKTRIVYFVLSLFCVISLTCIGFSSWTIAGSGALAISGGMTASPVVDFNDYLEITSIECFEFDKNGFVDTAYYNMGYIRVTYRLKTQKCYEDFGSKGKNMPVTFYLRGTTADGTASLGFITTDDAVTAGKLQIDAYTQSVAGLGFTCEVSGTNFLATGNITPSMYSYQDGNGQTVVDEEFDLVVTYGVYFEGDFLQTLYPLLVDVTTLENETPTVAQFYCHARVG
ncbi:MAG: hypothetical protein IKT32_01410, partial [Clostridia bacterium]|nr:hypothetical protein [Clostridia bacterium]